MPIYRLHERTILTSYVYPPIPDRRFDWSAVDDATYDGEGCPIGYGRTEQEAIDDLLDQLDQTPEPCTSAAYAAGCTCRMSPVYATSIDPPEPVIDKWCPIHGIDPDEALQRRRDRAAERDR